MCFVFENLSFKICRHNVHEEKALGRFEERKGLPQCDPNIQNNTLRMEPHRWVQFLDPCKLGDILTNKISFVENSDSLLDYYSITDDF